MVWGGLDIRFLFANCLRNQCDDFSKHEAVWGDKNYSNYTYTGLTDYAKMEHRKQCGNLQLQTNMMYARLVANDCSSKAGEVACVTQCDGGKLLHVYSY